MFCDVLLADEINRATPRTQSALFEAMAERQVTIDNRCYKLPTTFFVIAAQNPVDSHGAFPLPEAQRDRFALQLSIGYPDRKSALEMLRSDVGNVDHQPRLSEAVLSPSRLGELQQHVANVSVCDKLQRYLVDLAEATRERRELTLGLSPRGLLTWQRVAQARAHLQGRDFVTPDDVQEVARPVLTVRLMGEFESPDAIISELLASIPVPTFT